MIFQNRQNGNKEDNIDYINSIFSQIQNNIVLAAEIQNENAFSKLVLFLRGNLMYGSLFKSLNSYTKSSLMPSQIYPIIENDYRKKLIDLFAIRYSENIKFHKYDESEKLKFLEATYSGLIYLIKKIVDENNSQNFNFLTKRLKESMFNSNHSEENYYRFSFTFTILSWLFFLHQSEKIKLAEYDIAIFESNFNRIYEDKETIINTFFQFKRIARKGLWEIDNWEIKERPTGEAYFALMSSTWLNFGFTIMLLKYNILSYGYNLKEINITKDFEYSESDIKQNLTIIEQNKKKWFPIIFPNVTIINNENELIDLENSALPISLNDEFEQKKSKIIEFFNLLKKESEILDYRIISKVPLSQSKIEEFKKNVGKIWENNATIPKLLKHFNRVKYLPNDFEKKGLGIFTTMLKSRFAFIDGEKYQHIYGLSDFGGQTARAVNTNFYVEVLHYKENVSTVNKQNIKAEIETYIDGIIDKSNVVMFTNIGTLHLLNIDNNIIYQNESEVPFVHSTFRGLNVINKFEFKDYIFLVDLTAIDYKIYRKNDWYNKELLIEVTEPIKEEVIEIAKKTEEWKERDDVEYTAEEIEVLEKNSVNIKVLFKFDIEINDPSKIKIFKIEDLGL